MEETLYKSLYGHYASLCEYVIVQDRLGAVFAYCTAIFFTVLRNKKFNILH